MAILDIDGTLVDTNYHHAIAWYRAFRQQGLVLGLWRIHRRMGMGGDRLVADLAGDEAECEHGDAVRAAEAPLYAELMREVEAFADARGLIEDLRGRGHRLVLASSAKPAEVDHYLDLLGARELAEAWVSGADVEATKPASDVLEVALERAQASGAGAGAVLVGDSVWDCEAARRLGMPSIALLTGGFAEEQLRKAGATCVFESLAQLRERIAETPLAAS